MDESFQLAHAIGHIFGGRRNIGRVTGPAAADPVLAFSELPRLGVATASLRQENFMNFPDEAKGERKSVPHALQTMIEGRHVVGDLLHIVERHAGRLCAGPETPLKNYRAIQLGQARCTQFLRV